MWLSVDPLVETTMQPYSAFNNNPIRYNDPTGMIAEDPGDYYNSKGEHLGKDKNDDNKVYVADSVTKDKDGFVTSATNSKDLTKDYGITHSQVLDRANWIYAEGGYKIPEYYAYTIENAYLDKKIGNKKESKVYYWLMQDSSGRLEKDKYLSGGYENKTGKRFWDLRNTPNLFDSDMDSTIGAVLKSKIQPDKDPTGGTNSWLGYKSGAHTGEYYINSLGSRHFFMKYGISKKTNTEKKYITIK
jgi:hypothetical protein